VIIPGVQANNPSTRSTRATSGSSRSTTSPRRTASTRRPSITRVSGFIQSTHFKLGAISCITCHSPHAGQGKLKKVDKEACNKCHDASYTVEKFMPNTGKTADNLFVRSHTFPKNPREGRPGAGTMGGPNYYGD
jgi:hypothetical protein